LVLKIGLDKWAEYAGKFGFGKKTGLDISEESSGIRPNRKYYDRAFEKTGVRKVYHISLGIEAGRIEWLHPIQPRQ
jgi:penicillin-binding protein 2